MMVKQRMPHLFFLCFFGFALSLRSSPEAPRYFDQDCLVCHGDINLAQVLGDGTTRSLYVDPEKWAQDVHKKGQLSCVDCHISANPFVHFREGFIDADCAKCHPEQAEEYLKNVHFESIPLSPERELPLCYHCHTKHHILRHDDPSASIHQNNIDLTCGECHPEVMVKGLLKGSSIGKISGHRKGDLSEKFDMAVCFQCHNPAHGSDTVYKDFCIRCHDPNQKVNLVIGPTHLNSTKWTEYNALGSGLTLFLILGTFVYMGYRSRGMFGRKIRGWYTSMIVEKKDKEIKTEDLDKKDEGITPDSPENAVKEKEREEKNNPGEEEIKNSEPAALKQEDDEQ